MPVWLGGCCRGLVGAGVGGSFQGTRSSGALVPVPPRRLGAWQSADGSQMGTQYVHPGVVYAYAFQKCASSFGGCHNRFVVEHGKRGIIEIPARCERQGLCGALAGAAARVLSVRAGLSAAARCPPVLRAQPEERRREKDESETGGAKA